MVAYRGYADLRAVNALAAHASVSIAGPGWDAVAERLEVPRLGSLGAAIDHFAPADASSTYLQGSWPQFIKE